MLTNTQSPVTHSVYRANLKEKIATSQKQIRDKIIAANADITHRTQAVNAKRSYQTIEEEQLARQDILADQIKVWRRTFPTLLKNLSHM